MPAPNESDPLVSVISVFYNRSSYVRSSVASILDQTYRNLQVIIVDDGSTDDTLAALRSIDDDRLTILSQQNAGFTASMNNALAHARGTFVAVHASGDISYPTRIEKQAQVLKDRADIGVVGCWIEDDSNVSSESVVKRSPDGLPFYATLLKRGLFSHGEVMVRRDIYQAAGGYREFFKFAQDKDLWMRVARDTKYAIVPEVLYRRMKIEGGVSTNSDKLLLQTYLSDFATQCAERRYEDGTDMLDRFGNLAPFMRHRSASAARRIAWLGARLMVNGKIEEGWKLIRQAQAEKLTRQVAAISVLGMTHRVPALWKLVGRPSLKARLQSFEQ